MEQLWAQSQDIRTTEFIRQHKGVWQATRKNPVLCSPSYLCAGPYIRQSFHSSDQLRGRKVNPARESGRVGSTLHQQQQQYKCPGGGCKAP